MSTPNTWSSAALLAVCLLATSVSSAQTRSCRVVSSRNGEPVAGVAVSGLVTEAVWITDSLGNVRITAADPGPFRFSHIAFQTRILRPDSAAAHWVIHMTPLPYALDGIEVLSPLARFRRDSAYNHSFFRKELAAASFRPGAKLIFSQSWRGLEVGVQWSGIFSNLALIASGKKAQYKRFSRELQRIEANKYAAIRYTTALVSEQTGLPEDAAMAFIAAHPLDEDFLRNASELELKMRVRELYRGRK